MATSFIALVTICLLLAIVSFGATSMWGLFGTAIKLYLHDPKLKTVVNAILSLMLVYAAITLIGVI
jgi:threonine/homoserine/homoserine lactone efflux protein